MTLLTKITRGLKYCIAGAAVGSTLAVLHSNEWDLSSIGAVRSGRVTIAVCRIAADYKWSLWNVDPQSSEYQKIISQVHLRSAIKLRNLCCANRGSFIKVGQHIGALDYLLPKEYVNTMKVLHSQAPKSPTEDIYQVIKEDLGKEVSELFSEFDSIPIGAASLAQVHRACLKETGQVVAVKVQHRKVKANSAIDMASMELFVHVIAWLFPEFKFMWLAEETKKNLPVELDFLHEGKNCEQIGKLFGHIPFLKVPKIHWDLSSQRILTMEFCDGGEVTNIDYMIQHNISVKEVSDKLGKLYSEMIFVQGYIHCDPHPGNVLVNKTAEGKTQIVLLDHGLYATLTDQFRLNYCRLWMAIINADLEGIKYYSERMNCGSLYGLFACLLTARSWDAVTKGVGKQEFSNKEDNEIKDNAAEYLVQIADILNRVPREMLLILKANDLLRGLETTWNTRSNAQSFLTMSRCCISAVSAHQRSLCKSLMCKWRITFTELVAIWKINIFELYLWVRGTILGQYFGSLPVIS